MNEALKLPGLANCLDHADQGPDRHAEHRHAHPGRAQDLRRGSRHHRRDRGPGRIASARRSRERAASLPSAPASGYFLDFEWNREELARYGLSMEEAQAVVENAIGGENVTTTVEGRERYPVNVRYMRDFRSTWGAWAGCWSRPPAGRSRSRSPSSPRISTVERALHDPRRRRPADRLCLCGYRRPGPEQLHRRGRPAAQGKGEAAAGLRHFLERPVRGDAAGQGAADGWSCR